MTQYLEDTVRYSIFKKYLRYNTDTRYRYFYRVSASIGCIPSIRAGKIVTCVLINEFPVKFNSSGLFTAVVSISSGGHAQAADVISSICIFYSMEYLEDTVRYSQFEMHLRYDTDTENCSILDTVSKILPNPDAGNIQTHTCMHAIS